MPNQICKKCCMGCPEKVKRNAGIRGDCKMSPKNVNNKKKKHVLFSKDISALKFRRKDIRREDYI